MVGDGGVTGFYRWSGALPRSPGKPLRQESLEPAFMIPGASRGVRLLYTSTDGMNDRERIIVSGAVFFPQGERPKAGWPVIAWAHGTTGVADVCAPSRLPRSERDRAFLGAWLEAGFAIVATDYQGLGTPGPHPYLLYRPEAYSVLDGARAALEAFPDELQNKVVAVGQSQGSGAAIGAGLLAPAYAPDLNYLGTVAMGIVARVADPGQAPQVPLPASYEASAPVGAAYEMLFLTGTGQVVDPALDLKTFVSDKGQPLLRAALTSCLKDMITIAKESGLSARNIFNGDIARIDAIEKKVGAFPQALVSTPVFTATGLADREAGTAAQYNFISALCHAGTPLEWHYYPGHTHASTVNASFADSLPFARKLMAGEKPPGNCAALHPPGPTQQPLAEESESRGRHTRITNL